MYEADEPLRQPIRAAALVTGASYGVGAATAFALARCGYAVAITATRIGNLDQTRTALEAMNCKVVALELLQEDARSVEAVFHEAVSALGRIDVLVNNAGVNLRRSALDVTPEEWDRVMAANVTGPFQLAQQFARHLIAAGRGGSIVNIASTHGLVGAPDRSTYAISKGALIQMTRALAIEWAPHGIRVNAIAPGRMLTASPSRATTGSDETYMASMLGRIPLGRLATADEVADAVVYLAGAAAKSITGHTLLIDGGLTAS